MLTGLPQSRTFLCGCSGGVQRDADTGLPGRTFCSSAAIIWHPGKLRSSLALFLDLEDAEDVRCRVDDPGGPGEADVGDAVFGL